MLAKVPLDCLWCGKAFVPRNFREKCCCRAHGILSRTQSLENKLRDSERYWSNRDTILANIKERYKSDEAYRERVKSQTAKWRRENKELVNQINRANRAKKRRIASTQGG